MKRILILISLFTGCALYNDIEVQNAISDDNLIKVESLYFELKNKDHVDKQLLQDIEIYLANHYFGIGNEYKLKGEF